MLSMSPIITVVAASIFLKETIQISHAIAAVLGLIGAILLAQPTFLFGRHDDNNNNENDSNSVGYLTGFVGACIGASVFILVRKAGKVGVHTLQLLFSWCFFSIIYCLLWGIMTLVFRSPEDEDHAVTQSVLAAVQKTRRSWMYVLGVCIVGTAGHFLLNYAGMLAPAGIGSMTRLSGMMWSYLLEMYVFHQLPQFRTVLGFSFILFSLVLIALEKHYHNNNNSNSQNINEEYNKNSSESTRLPLIQQADCYDSTSCCNTVDDNEKRVVL